MESYVFFCAHEKSNLAKNADPTFFKTGFRNWKRATQKCSEQMSKAMHTNHYPLPKNKTSRCPIIFSQSCTATGIKVVFHENCGLLARQGAALRGHEAEEGNLHQLLKVRCEDDPGLEKWLSTRKHDYTSPKIQNEFLNLFANSIIREIISSIHMRPLLQYSIIIDGTQDIEGTEHVSRM